MSFLTPLYIAGIAAVTLPILFHLIKRTPQNRIPFSTLAFLMPSPPKVTRRSRIEHWLLLALRALALCLLSFAFARPFLREAVGTTQPVSQGRRVAILLDTSASMQRGTLWTDALQRVERVLSGTQAEDDVAIYTFGDRVEPVISFQDWSSLDRGTRLEIARRRLAEHAPGWGATELGEALIAGAESFQPAGQGEGVDPRPKQVVLVSDLQTGSRRQSLRSYAWPEDVRLLVERVDVPDPTNAGVQLAAADPSLPTANENVVRVRVTNAASSSVDRFQIRWQRQVDDVVSSGPWIEAYVPAGRARIVRIPDIPNPATGLRVVLEGDAHIFDNTIYVDPPTPRTMTVLYLGSERADDPSQPRYYLERAFPPTPLRRIDVRTQDDADPVLWNAKDMPLVVVTEPISPEGVESLRPVVESGGTLLLVPKTSSDCDLLGQLLGLPLLNAREADLNGYAMLSKIDFDHPIFAPFAESQFADFTGIHFWKHRSIEPEALPAGAVLASFDDGDPALVTFSIGSGRILLLTAGWHPEDSQLALSSRFPPLLNGILETAAGGIEQAAYVEVGDSLTIPLASAAAEGKTFVQTPDQRKISIEPSQLAFLETNVPGPYVISTPSEASRYVVNLAADESKTDPLNVEALEALGVQTEAQDSERHAIRAHELERQLQVEELEREQQIWRWLLLAVAVVLIGETWLARRTAVTQPS